MAPEETLENWDDLSGDWYAVDESRLNKQMRLFVGREHDAKSLARRLAAGDGMVDADGNLAAPGEFGDMGYYRCTIIDDDAAKDWFEHQAQESPSVYWLPDEFVSVADAAKLSGFSRPSIQKAIERGDVYADKFGGAWMVERASLDKWTSTPHPIGRPKNQTKKDARDI